MVPFTGKTEEAYVEYRAGLEGRAIFNAFEIFKDLEQHHPDFKEGWLPYNSIGYLQGIELAGLYKKWKKVSWTIRAWSTLSPPRCRTALTTWTAC